MFDLHKNIQDLCEKRGVTVSKMCLDIGASKSLMSNLKKNPSATLSMKSASKIAEYLGVSVDVVLHGPEKQKSPEHIDDALWADAMDYAQAVHDDPQLRSLLSAAKNLDADEREALTTLIKKLRRESQGGEEY